MIGNIWKGSTPKLDHNQLTNHCIHSSTVMFYMRSCNLNRKSEDHFNLSFEAHYFTIYQNMHKVYYEVSLELTSFCWCIIISTVTCKDFSISLFCSLIIWILAYTNIMKYSFIIWGHSTVSHCMHRDFDTIWTEHTDRIHIDHTWQIKQWNASTQYFSSEIWLSE